MTAGYDVVVIGAGIVGSAIARELSGYRLSVALVDARDDVGDGTSKANTAILHTGFDATPGTLESALVAHGYHLLGAYAAEVGLAVEMGADAADVGLTIHAHPTLSETVAFSAEAFEGTLTDLYLPKR